NRPLRQVDERLRAEAVSRGDEHRISVLRSQREERGECASHIDDLRAMRAPGDGAETLRRRLARVEVDPGGSVGERFAARVSHRRLSWGGESETSAEAP